MSRVAIYVRRSEKGEEDKNSSIETQRKETTELALQDGHTVVEEYSDPGGRSATLNRPVLNRLILDAKLGKFETVLVWKWDRFSRELDQATVAITQLKSYGVDVKSVHEQVPETAVGSLMRQVYLFAGQQQRESIVLNIRAGKKARADAGKLLSRCRPLYGYMFADEKHERYIPNPVTAPIVHRIFRMTLEGISLIQICLTLDQEGIAVSRPKNANSTWRKSGVSKILNNRAYMGHMLKHRMEVYYVTVPDPETGGYKDILRARPRSADDPLAAEEYGPETCPPLVSEKDWHAVQKILIRNREESSRRMRQPDAALLRSGFARCGYCGKAIVCCWSAHQQLYRYHCCAPGNGLPCEGRYFGWLCRDLDAYVWDWTVRALSNPQLVREKYERWKQIKDQETIGEQDQLKAARATLKSTEERYEAYASEIGTTQNATVRATLIKNMEDADAERELYLVQIATLEDRLADTTSRDAVLHDFLAAAAQWSGNLQGLDFDSRRRVLRAFGIRAIVRSKRDASPVQMEWALGEIDQPPFEFPSTTSARG